jgi:tetraacyldisaccharide 4'-kinase
MRSFWQHIMDQRSARSPTATLARSMLKGFSVPYWFAAELKNRLYDQGCLKGERLPARVISVGNLSVGGTGKTPLTIALARYYKGRGIPSAILSRGYRGSSRKDVTIVSDGREVFHGPAHVGDEPYLMGLRSGVPVLVGRKRWKTGLEAVWRFGARVLIMDDGFQHRRVARDVDIVLLDARRPILKEWVLPAGVWREPVNALARAHILVLSGYSRNGICEENERFLRRTFPRHPLFKAACQPESLMAGSEELSPSELAERKVLIFSGLAANEQFLDTVKRLQATVLHFERFSDHHFYRRQDIERLKELKRRSGAEILLTTEKDGVKLGQLADDTFQPWILRIRFQVLEREADFFRLTGNEAS